MVATDEEDVVGLVEEMGFQPSSELSSNCGTQTNECREYRAVNILVLGLSSCGHSVISLLSDPVFISMDFPPTNIQHTSEFYTCRHTLCQIVILLCYEVFRVYCS